MSDLVASRYPRPSEPPVYHSTHAARPLSVGRLYSLLDSVFVVAGLLMTFWFAGLLLLSSLELAWQGLVLVVAFWLVLTYLALPRLHQLFTTLYVPDYFLARTKTGDGLLGDPVNLAFLGSRDQLVAAMSRAGWTPADKITLRSSWGIVKSTVLGVSYPSAPVSDLFLFGRRQEFAFQKEVDGSASSRHHVRFWPTPDGWRLPGGECAQWLAAGTYDVSVGVSRWTLQVTHKIDADVDAERDFIIQSLQFSDPGVSVRVLEDFSVAFHDVNGGGDAIRTDGNLPIVDLRDVSSVVPDAAPLSEGALAPLSPGVSGPSDDQGLLQQHLPPKSLAWVGGVLALKTAVVLLMWALLAFHSAPTGLSPSEMGIFVGITAVTAVSDVLYLLTLRQFRWARLLLLILVTASGVVELAQLASLAQPSLNAFVDPGLTLLLILSLSATSVRQWVFAVKGRSGLRGTAARVGASS